ncbi:HET-domain-containing protein [Hyaloscypha variabilis F]|uniref:HET-domain-containing protein n=1 Tax=Hyaloscypha variabilis (strain UAMH 11265 / GT02V1 / F) TaxID=1149755 RepID=A0A2J6R0K4_HYAVF|nr:HET-domain-containing protein [Hyaloscypha variabilis F]
MWLLSTSFTKDRGERPWSGMKLEEFFGSQIPPYAILSHTWGTEEITFQDIASSSLSPSHKAGFAKLEGCCTRAAQDGYDYVWIDTCCIDKTSSAELSEAINSMYKWYAEADICYAYLSDVRSAFVDSCQSDTLEASRPTKDFQTTKWFTRGWTLQELIAPRSVEFYAEDWTDLGTKSSRRDEISLITGIDVRVLDGENPAICNVAERLSWAASRQTTRIEDAAYCLLGIFQVHMPLLYGESDRALIRLQEEILKTTEDYTLLARSSGILLVPHTYGFSGALARQLAEFKNTQHSLWAYSNLVNVSHKTSLGLKNVVADVTPTLTARGLHICLPVLKVSSDEYYAYLYCRLLKTDELVCLPLMQAHTSENRFARRLGYNDGDLKRFPSTKLTAFRLLTIYIEQAPPVGPRRTLPRNRDFSIATLDATATTGLNSAVSRACTVSTSWGSSTNVLPWRTTIQAQSNKANFGLSALFVLGSGDSFMVAFGIKSSKLWCCVLLGDEPPFDPVSREHSHEWDSWWKYQRFVPRVLVDRASKNLRMNDRVVNISIRKVASGLAVSVCINEPNYIGEPVLITEKNA